MDIYQDNQLGEGVGDAETGTFRTRNGYVKVPTNGISEQLVCACVVCCFGTMAFFVGVSAF